MRFRLTDVVVLTGVAVAGGIAGAPSPVEADAGRTTGAIVAQLRESGLGGRELVDAAVAAVNKGFGFHSVWHLWESPETALANGRGWSHQYNEVLADVLQALGLEVRRVHAARVRGWRHPWFFASHSWVKVNLDGRWLDACASRAGNRVGDVGFVPVSEEMAYRRSTPWTVALGLVPFITIGVWRAWLTGREVSPWIYRRRD